MKTIYLLIMILLGYSHLTLAQQAVYRGTGQISFSATAPLDLIRGTSTEITGFIDMQTGKLSFSVPVSSFQFANSLMQEHFNQKYMESGRFPKATFTGKVKSFQQKSVQEVTAHGTLTIHGVEQRRQVKGTLTQQGDRLYLKASFVVRTGDHNIKSPGLVDDSMAERIDTQLEMLLLPTQNRQGIISLNQKKRVK
ncbi:MAG: YceI family protein [Hymenobacteraceae bacterium]|nr:YceI family protein [Hymenobacteraceae bacterium]